MKKVVLKSILFVLIFCILLSLVSALVVNVERFGYQNISEFYDQRDDSLDAVYIGSSNCYLFWNSAVAWEEYGITVYPYSCNANSFFTTKYIMEDVRNTQKNAKFIVNLNTITDGELDNIHMHNIIGCMPFSFNKIKMIDYLCDIGDYEGTDRAEFYFPFIRFHGDWTTMYFASKLEVKPTGYKGASVYSGYLNSSVDVSEIYTAPKEKIKLSEKITSCTNELLTYCEEEDIDVVFVVVPQAKANQYEVDRLKTFAGYISDKGYTVLDFSENFEDEMNIDMTKDFYNGPHTNVHGSIKFTHRLSEYLVDMYGFEDKRNNEEYSDWNTAYESYMNVAISHILDFELDYTHRDFSLEEPDFEVEAKEGNANIFVNAIEDAQGYVIYRKDGFDSQWKTIAEIANKEKINEHIDRDLVKETQYYYTVVPYALKDGERYYGDFNYLGKAITP